MSMIHDAKVVATTAFDMTAQTLRRFTVVVSSADTNAATPEEIHDLAMLLFTSHAPPVEPGEYSDADKEKLNRLATQDGIEDDGGDDDPDPDDDMPEWAEHVVPAHVNIALSALDGNPELAFWDDDQRKALATTLELALSVEHRNTEAGQRWLALVDLAGSGRLADDGGRWTPDQFAAYIRRRAG